MSLIVHAFVVKGEKKINEMMKIRKVLMVDAVLDYDDAGANTRHDPPKRKPPGGRP